MLNVTRLRPCVIALAALICVSAPARADVGVVLNDTVAHGAAWITGAGHSAVYFSRICAASPVRLRLCVEGEDGSIMSSYADFGEDQRYEWNVVPLNVYLYGVEDKQKRPLLGSERVKMVLERSYQESHLAEACSLDSCLSSEKGQWRAMVAATQIRTMYVFSVSTTREEDREFIERFNARPNVGRFNGFTRNCADFTRDVINLFFPNSVKRNILNDFGMTSPKSVARSFTQFAHRNPDRQYRVMHFSQVPGTIKRSSPAREGTEQLVRSQKLLLPVLFLQAPAAGISAVTYLFTGHFSARRELERFEAQQAKINGEDRAAGATWGTYRKEFASVASDARQAGIIRSRKDLKSVFRNLDAQGSLTQNDEGQLWIEIPGEGGQRTMRLGLDAAGIVSETSDPILAYRLMLARVDHALKSSANDRPRLEAFERDWQLLQDTRESAEAWLQDPERNPRGENARSSKSIIPSS